MGEETIWNDLGNRAPHLIQHFQEQEFLQLFHTNSVLINLVKDEARLKDDGRDAGVKPEAVEFLIIEVKKAAPGEFQDGAGAGGHGGDGAAGHGADAGEHGIVGRFLGSYSIIFCFEKLCQVIAISLLFGANGGSIKKESMTTVALWADMSTCMVIFFCIVITVIENAYGESNIKSGLDHLFSHVEQITAKLQYRLGFIFVSFALQISVVFFAFVPLSTSAEKALNAVNSYWEALLGFLVVWGAWVIHTNIFVQEVVPAVCSAWVWVRLFISVGESCFSSACRHTAGGWVGSISVALVFGACQCFALLYCLSGATKKQKSVAGYVCLGDVSLTIILVWVSHGSYNFGQSPFVAWTGNFYAISVVIWSFVEYYLNCCDLSSEMTKLHQPEFSPWKSIASSVFASCCGCGVWSLAVSTRQPKYFFFGELIGSVAGFAVVLPIFMIFGRLFSRVNVSFGESLLYMFGVIIFVFLRIQFDGLASSIWAIIGGLPLAVVVLREWCSRSERISDVRARALKKPEELRNLKDGAA